MKIKLLSFLLIIVLANLLEAQNSNNGFLYQHYHKLDEDKKLEVAKIESCLGHITTAIFGPMKKRRNPIG